MTLKQHKLTVTPEMIEAGDKVLSRYWNGLGVQRKSVVRAVVEAAMHQASIPTEATGDDVEQVRDVLRQSRPYVADTLSSLSMPSQHREIAKVKSLLIQIDATLSPNRVSQSAVDLAAKAFDAIIHEYRTAPNNGAAGVDVMFEIARDARAALATQPATDTRIPINEEATDAK